MVSQTTFITTLVGTVFASTGFWAFLTHLVQSRSSRCSAESQMLKGLAHDRITHLGTCYITQGYISKDDYENLYEYLYQPYKNLGGNGTVDKIMKEIDALPFTKAKKEE